jgi:hypothetical protein
MHCQVSVLPLQLPNLIHQIYLVWVIFVLFNPILDCAQLHLLRAECLLNVKVLQVHLLQVLVLLAHLFEENPVFFRGLLEEFSYRLFFCFFCLFVELGAPSGKQLVHVLQSVQVLTISSLHTTIC